MRKGNFTTVWTTLTILIISGTFAYLTNILMNKLGAGAVVLAFVLSILAILFFLVLAMLAIVLAIVMLSDCVHYYASVREKREMNRKQPPLDNNSTLRGTYTYKPRWVQRKQPPDNTTSNGC